VLICLVFFFSLFFRFASYNRVSVLCTGTSGDILIEFPSGLAMRM
jgi:hypothetical protein